MVVDQRSRAFEPKRGDLGEYFAFVRNARPENPVERRDAVGRHDQQLVAELIDVSNLALPIGRAIAERGLEKRRGQRQRILSFCER
jgi:hypothetical protein